jgi:hypothetical protein
MRGIQIRSQRSGMTRGSLASVASGFLALTLVTAAPAAAAPASDAPRTGLAAAPTAGFSINLYGKGDFVSQYTAYWCIGASMQMMLNIIGVTDDDRRTSQVRYMRVARSSGPSLRQVDHGQTADNAGGLRGAGSGGWARGLTALGGGRYEERALDGFGVATRAAAQALRTTNRPVGLIVWRGAHAWVMTGFTATADPLADPDFRVTGVYIQDPWYPRVSSIWGPGQKPNSWISLKALKSDFLPRRGGRWHPGLAGKFVLVEPVDHDLWAPQLGRMV